MTGNNSVDLRRDRFKGCLVGQCLGDALGLVALGRPRDECPGVVKASLDIHMLLFVDDYGQYSAVSQCARELMLSLSEYQGPDRHDPFYEVRVELNLESWECRGFEPDDYAKRMQTLFTEGRLSERGGPTEQSCERMHNGMPWFLAGEAIGGMCNDSAARAAPIGLFFWNHTSAIITTALKQSMITQRDRRCSAGAISIAGAVALNLRQTELANTFTTTLATWVKYYDPVLADGIMALAKWRDLAPDAAYDKIAGLGLPAESMQPLRDNWGGITPVVTESVLWSLYAFLHKPESYIDAIDTAVSGGGDVTTLAAMTGAISGAYLGLTGMNQDNGATQALTDRGAFEYDALVELAAQACAASERRYDATGLFTLSPCDSESIEDEKYYAIANIVDEKPMSVLQWATLCRPKIKIQCGDVKECNADALVVPINCLPSAYVWPQISDIINWSPPLKVMRERSKTGVIAAGQVGLTTLESDLWFQCVLHAAVVETIAICASDGAVSLHQRLDPDVLQQATLNALLMAMQLRVRSLAFVPMAVVDTMPMSMCANIMLRTVADFGKRAPESCMDRIIFLLANAEEEAIFNTAYRATCRFG